MPHDAQVYEVPGAFESGPYYLDRYSAMIHLPHRIPLGFHGLYIPREDITPKQV